MRHQSDHRINNKREYLRIRTNRPIMYRKASGTRPYEASATDLSMDGVAIQTGHPLEKGEPLEVWIAVGSKPVSYSAKVIYVERLKGGRFRTGLQFQGTSEGKRRLLKRYLSRIRLDTRSFLTDKLVWKLIQQVNGTLVNLKLYGADHPGTAGAIRKAHASLIEILEQKGELTLRVVDSTLVVNELPVEQYDTVFTKFIEELMIRNIERLVFQLGVSQDEFKAFLNCMNQQPESLRAHGGAQEYLETHGEGHLRAS
jgi:hypothetical protein